MILMGPHHEARDSGVPYFQTKPHDLIQNFDRRKWMKIASRELARAVLVFLWVPASCDVATLACGECTEFLWKRAVFIAFPPEYWARLQELILIDARVETHVAVNI